MSQTNSSPKLLCNFDRIGFQTFGMVTFRFPVETEYFLGTFWTQEEEPAEPAESRSTVTK